MMRHDDLELSNLLVFWEELYYNKKTNSRDVFRNHFIIQEVTLIEDTDDDCFRIEGYSLKRVENNNLRLIKQVVPKCRVIDGNVHAFPSDNKIAIGQSVWEIEIVPTP